MATEEQPPRTGGLFLLRLLHQMESAGFIDQAPTTSLLTHSQMPIQN